MNILKDLRAKKGVLQKDVANFLQIDRTTYVKYENGDSEPNLQMIKKIADYFNVSVDYLLEREQFVLHKKNDTITDIILKLRSDEKLLEITNMICRLPEEQLSFIQSLLSTFNNSK